MQVKEAFILLRVVLLTCLLIHRIKRKLKEGRERKLIQWISVDYGELLEKVTVILL